MTTKKIALFTTVLLTHMEALSSLSEPRDDAYTAIGNSKCINAIHQVHRAMKTGFGVQLEM